MREIVFSETRAGLFEPAPTAAQKQRTSRAKRKSELDRIKRAREIEGHIVGVLGSIFIVVTFGAIAYAWFVSWP